MKNYFNQLTLREQLVELGKCRLMTQDEFKDGTAALQNKKIVILGCGAQGLNQGLNLRDSGLDVAFGLRNEAITLKRTSYKNATSNGFRTGTFEELIPYADLVINLTPDKQHSAVVKQAMPLMKSGATLSYSHGFNIVEEGLEIRKDLTVIMVAPKSPGSEVRNEYLRGFGVPTLIAVHNNNDPEKKGLEWAKAYAYAMGGNRAGVLHSSFVAEVKSDLMGEQTILCGVLQSASIVCFNKMMAEGIDKNFAANLVQYGWESITEALKLGGITNMMDRLSNPAKLKAFDLSEDLKKLMKPLFEEHMDDIMTGHFSKTMMEDWANNDFNLLKWRALTAETNFEKTEALEHRFADQHYFDHGTLMVAFVKAGVELAFEVMTESGIIAESAYFESLHETPLIANTIARKKLFEMNNIISDTAEYGCYLFDHACQPLIYDFVNHQPLDVIGKSFEKENEINQNLNLNLIRVNQAIRNHPIEKVGEKIRNAMHNTMSFHYDTNPTVTQEFTKES